MLRVLGVLLLGMLMTTAAYAQEPIKLAAAGSLRNAMTELAAAFTKQTGLPVALEFGASGILRQRLASGATGEVFASANLEHPTQLAQAGKAVNPVVFARNRLCALAAPTLRVESGTLLNVMLDPAVKLGTSTPKFDPAGDYAWEVFRKAEALQPGARTKLEAKALQLTGSPNSPLPPTDRVIYGVLVNERKADLMLVYCTGARDAAREVPGLQVIELPPPLAVGADYGLSVMLGSRSDAYRLALYILSPAGQEILANHGFSAPNLPAKP